MGMMGFGSDAGSVSESGSRVGSRPASRMGWREERTRSAESGGGSMMEMRFLDLGGGGAYIK